MRVDILNSDFCHGISMKGEGRENPQGFAKPFAPNEMKLDGWPTLHFLELSTMSP